MTGTLVAALVMLAAILAFCWLFALWMDRYAPRGFVRKEWDDEDWRHTEGLPDLEDER